MTPDTIINACAKAAGVTPEDIKGKSRFQEYAHPRHVAAYLMRKRAGMTWKATAKALGNRNHSTAIHSTETVQAIVDRIDHYKNSPDNSGGRIARVYLAVVADLGDQEARQKIESVNIRPAADCAPAPRMTGWLRRYERRQREREQRKSVHKKLPYAGQCMSEAR